MKRIIWILMAVLLLPGAAMADESRDAPDVLVLELVATPTPEPAATPVPTPTPTPQPELPHYPYDEAEARCITRAIWSVVPVGATPETKQAFAEIPQNMVADGRYRDTIRYTLLMETEFPGYDPEAHRSSENAAIADYVMRSWQHAQRTGDWSYRLTPPTGVRYAFYHDGGRVYIRVMDFDWRVVYDSGTE